MEIIRKISTRYSFKTALILTAFLVSSVTLIGITTQQPVPAWWFAFTPILLRMLKS